MPGAAKFYSIRPMDYVLATSVTSENTSTTHPIEHALDRNLLTYWSPTTVAEQVIVLDLQNGLQELITPLANRDFSGAGNWTNTTWDTWTVGDHKLTLQAADVNDIGYLAAAGFAGFAAGVCYRITYDWTPTFGLTAQFLCGGSSQLIGSLVSGTAQTLTFTCTTASTTLVLLANTTGTGLLDNVSVRAITNEASYAVKGFALWINNYNTEFGTTHGAKIEYSDDNTNWTQVADRDIQDEMTSGVLGDPLRIYIFGASYIHRYWRLTLHDASQIIKLGQIMLLSEFDFGTHAVYPEQNERTYRNNKRRLDDGALVVDPGSRTPIYRFTRQYRIAGTAALTVLENMFDACRGGQTLLVLNEGTDYYVVNLVTDSLTVSENDYHYYTVGMEFETLPYITDGDVM